MTRFYQGLYYDNLGVSYSAGTFTIKGANGLDFSSLNPAVIVLPSKSNPGQFVKYQVTANQSFEDDAGTSDIIGNLFGFTTSVAITDDVPFFIYAVCNDSEDTIQFMLSRYPHVITSASTIGTPSSATANTEESMWSFDDITTTLYDSNPCMCIGSFRMKMSASDDWTVSTLSTDGIGYFQENKVFNTPKGQFGANSGTLIFDNGGTAATFSTQLGQYSVLKNGYCKYNVTLTGDGGVDGSGSVYIFNSCPYKCVSASSYPQFGFGRITIAGGVPEGMYVQSNNAANKIVVSKYGVQDLYWSAFTNGNRLIQYQFYFRIGPII